MSVKNPVEKKAMAFVDLPPLVYIDDSDSNSDSGLDDSLASLSEFDDYYQEVHNLEDIPLLIEIPHLPDQIGEIIEDLEVSTDNAECLRMWDELPYLPEDQNEDIIEAEDQFDEQPLHLHFLHPEPDHWETDSYDDSDSDPGLDDSIISLIDDHDEFFPEPVDESDNEIKESEDMERKIKIVMNLTEIVTRGPARGALRNNNGNILDAITELCPDRSNDNYSPEKSDAKDDLSWRKRCHNGLRYIFGYRPLWQFEI